VKALCFNTFGSPDVLYYAEIANPVLKSNEILIATKAIGLNFADVYRRQGNYHLVGNPPFIAGYEGAGLVANPNGHSNFKVGDRVCFADVPLANAELVAAAIDHIIPLPAAITFETAAASMLQGLTAQYLTQDSYQVKKGDLVLVHAAAGGVGQLLVQICKHLGAKVIGLTSSLDKQQTALDAGATEVFLYSENWEEKVLSSTDNKGVDIVYESIGSTLSQSISITKTCGTVVFFGFAGGNPPMVDPRMLMDKSLTLTGGDLWSYLISKEERIKRSEKLFNWILEGAIKIQIDQTFSLSEGQKAHEYIESRKSKGKILLLP
jgi:NADPH:quinone reductase